MRIHGSHFAPFAPSTFIRFAVVLSLCAGVAALADVGAHRRTAGPQAVKPVAAAPLPTDRLPLAAPPFARVQRLASPDVDALLAEDAQVNDGRLRIGVPLDVTVTAGDGEWQHVPGAGWLWTVSIEVEEAIAIRLHFSGTDIPAGGELVVRDATGVQQVYGPVRGRGENETGAFITPPTLGDDVLVEYFEPADGAEPPALPFRIENVTNIYSPAFLGDGLTLREGACHNDVTCFPAWAAQALAVARLVVTDGGTFNCTAALLNTDTADETPYLLTANHCANDEAAANSIVAYWFFQTADCNDPPPPLGPSSSNTTIIEFSPTVVSGFQAGSDHALLLLRGALPAGVTWAGWTSNTVGNGVACTNVHHPTGAYKRINFGNTILHPFGDSADYNGVLWTSGTVEGGSSGSPLFRDSDQLIFAVASHTADPANCTNQDGPSGFGRLSRFYPQISDDLVAGPDDDLEPNDTCAGAATIGAGMFVDRNVKSTSEDWYRIDVGGCERLDVQAGFLHAWGDIDIELYDACGGALLDDSTSATDNESVLLNNTGHPTTTYLRVYLAGTDTHAEYDLSISFTSIGNAPVITDQPDGQTVTQGDPVVFGVVATGDAPLTYQWKKDGVEILGATSDTYAIASAEPNDAGDYTVVVSNDCNDVESNVATLVVETLGCGDFDGDGDVDTADFALFAQCFGGSLNPPAPGCAPGVDADCDGDDDVDTADFAIFAQNFTGSM